MEAAKQLKLLGYNATIYEQEPKLGGHVSKWDRLFPNQNHAQGVITSLVSSLDGVEVHCSALVENISPIEGKFNIKVNSKLNLFDAVVVATGFELFPAEKKEEYGYSIFENVITSAELEGMFIEKGRPLMANGKLPTRVAFIHCVGSRDEKVNRPYCSKVCCVTAVKQAIEVKEALPNCEVYNFYMDLRMFGPGYEDLYKTAQVKGVNFIRGRLSETSEMEGGRILIKAEDTLSSRPLKMSVDMVVLMVGMSPLRSTRMLLENVSTEINSDGFLQVKDYHTDPTKTNVDGIFVAGACTGPNNITDSINSARSAAMDVHRFLCNNNLP